MLSITTKNDLLRCVRNELVPENPRVTSYGIEGLLQYRVNKNKRHPDSIQLYDKDRNRYYGKTITAECYAKIYNIKIDYILAESSDTIFNCWSFLRRFVCGVANINNGVEEYALNNLDNLFCNYKDLKAILDKLADYHHCLANLMPAPRGFNGYKNRDGKGTHDKDNDMPDLYYKRAETDFPDKFYWINKNMDKYCLYFFKEYKSNLVNGVADKALNINDKKELKEFEKSIEDAIECIEKRADNLYCKMQKYSS